jgi:elongator complex protein 1
MTEFLADMKTQLNAQVPRLRELRAKKLENPAAFFDAANEGDMKDFPDNVSLAPTDTTSGGTFMTRYTARTGSTLNTQTTRRTSKKKRQEERKRARGKKGTVYEEEYLVNSIERLIARINELVDEKDGEVGRLVEGLVRRQMRERGDAVTNSAGEVLRLCREAVEEMYEKKVEQKEGEGDGEVQGEEAWAPKGGDATLWASIEEVGKKRDAPVVKALGRLNLLG